MMLYNQTKRVIIIGVLVCLAVFASRNSGGSSSNSIVRIFHPWDIYYCTQFYSSRDTLDWIKELRSKGIQAELRIYASDKTEVMKYIKDAESRGIPYWFTAISSDYYNKKTKSSYISGRDIGWSEGDSEEFCMKNPLCKGLFFHELGETNAYKWLWPATVIKNLESAKRHGKPVIWNDHKTGWNAFEETGMGFMNQCFTVTLKCTFHKFKNLIIPMWANNSKDGDWEKARDYVNNSLAPLCQKRAGASIQGWYWDENKRGSILDMPADKWKYFCDLSQQDGNGWQQYEAGWNTPNGRKGILNHLSRFQGTSQNKLKKIKGRKAF